MLHTRFKNYILHLSILCVLTFIPFVSANAFDASALKKDKNSTEEASNSATVKEVATNANHQEMIESGRKLFGNTCLFCHGAKGKGARAPSLIAGHWAPGGANDDAYMLDVILNGRANTIMGSFKESHSIVEIKSIIAFLRHEAKLLAASKTK